MLCSCSGGSACLLSPRERSRQRCGVVPKPHSPTGSPAASWPSCHQHPPCIDIGGGHKGVLGPQNQSASPSAVFLSSPPHTRAGEGIRGPGRRTVLPRRRESTRHQVRVTHAAAPRRCTPVPPGTSRNLSALSQAWRAGRHQSSLPQPNLGVPHLLAGLAPKHVNSSPLTLIKACKADPKPSPLPLPALCMPPRSPNATRQLALQPPVAQTLLPRVPDREKSQNISPGLPTPGPCRAPP